MKKICYVTTLSISIRAFFVDQLKYLSENGFDITVICSPDDTLQERLGENIKFVPVSIPRGMHPFGMLKSIFKLKRIFSREKFQLVQYSTPNAAFCASVAAVIAKIAVRNYHLMGLRYLGDENLKRKLLYKIEKFTCAQSTSIECVSPSNLELAVKSGLFPREKGNVVFNGSSGGVNTERFNKKYREEYRYDIRKKYNIPGDAFVFGFVGRITRDKGVNEILRAYKKLNNSYLMVVGNEENTSGLDTKLYNESKDNPQIIYTGQVEDIERYYCAIDVLLLPSYREGFGNVVVEAAAMGTPAIISRIPGPIDAITEGETALVVNPRDEESLFNAMMRIRSEDLCKEMGVSAAEFAYSHFDSKILNEKILQHKNFLLKGNDYEKNRDYQSLEL